MKISERGDRGDDRVLARPAPRCRSPYACRSSRRALALPAGCRCVSLDGCCRLRAAASGSGISRVVLQRRCRDVAVTLRGGAATSSFSRRRCTRSTTRCASTSAPSTWPASTYSARTSSRRWQTRAWTAACWSTSPSSPLIPSSPPLPHALPTLPPHLCLPAASPRVWDAITRRPGEGYRGGAVGGAGPLPPAT